MKIGLVLLSLMLLVGVQASQTAQGGTAPEPATTSPSALASMKSEFPIGTWFDGRVEGINCPAGYHNVPKDMAAAKEYYWRNFQDMKDHGLGVVVVPNTPPDYRETLLSVADKVGLKVVLELVELAYPEFGGRYSVRSPESVQDEAELLKYCDELTSAIRKHPSLFCYQILDEPSAEQFGNFARANRALEKIDPARPSFSCLCNEGELSRTAAMGTQMVVFDRYPLRKPSKPGDYDFAPFRALLDNLDRAAGELPYWMVLQTCAMDKPEGLRYPSAAELRLMTWLSAAHNAKGIFFFLHNSHTQEERLQGLVDLDMTPHAIYAEVADLSRTLKRLAPRLLLIGRTEKEVVKAREGFDVQAFEDSPDAPTPTGSRYVWVVNLDVLRSGQFEGELVGVKSGDLSLRDLITDTPVDVKREGGLARFSLRLPPGGAALLRVPKGE